MFILTQNMWFPPKLGVKLWHFFFHIYLKSIGANAVLEGGHVPKATVRYLNIWQRNSGSFDKTDW